MEIELVFERSDAATRLVAHAAQARRTFPDRLRARAFAGARVTAVIYGGPRVTLPKPLDFHMEDRLWHAAYRRGSLRAILLVGRVADKLRVLQGVEGVPNDLAPDYADIRAALLRYASWRAHPENAASIADAEKVRSTTSNTSVASLATAHLCATGHIDAIDRATCQWLPGDCSDW